MNSFPILCTLLGTVSAANVFTFPDEVCSGGTTTASCSRNINSLIWEYDGGRVVALTDQDTVGATTTHTVGGVAFSVTLISQSSTLTSSNISFTASPATDGKVLRCAGAEASEATIRVVSDAANVFIFPDEVCSGDTATASCSRNINSLVWEYDGRRVVALTDQDTVGATTTHTVGGVAFSVTLISQSSTLTSSNISFTASPATDGKVLRCAGAEASTATIRVVSDATPPDVSAVQLAGIINEANTVRLTLQFTITNGRGTPTLEVAPSAESLGSLQSTTSSTFSAAITVLYNTNYMIIITASNCAGPDRKIISFLKVNCYTPNVAADVRVWPFTNTLVGATITYSCSDGYWPQTNHTSQCTQVGSGGVWMPEPALTCSIVCSAPPSPLNGSVQANESRTYVEGDVVNFQCLSGLSPADVMTATCTMEGSWRPDPQLLSCSSATEDTTTTTATKSTQVSVPVVVAAGVCIFLLGLLCGVAAGVGAVIVYNKCNRETHTLPSQPPPPAPLYEDIELPTTTKHEVDLQHNVAYGHVH